MTKTELMDRAKGVANLARHLNISSQAISKWPEDRVPPLRVYQLKERCPDWFEDVAAESNNESVCK